jgi:hypothetical protein
MLLRVVLQTLRPARVSLCEGNHNSVKIGVTRFHFRVDWLLGLEGLVSKHRESTYRGGRFDRWVKVKNRRHPAFSRVID